MPADMHEFTHLYKRLYMHNTPCIKTQLHRSYLPRSDTDTDTDTDRDGRADGQTDGRPDGRTDGRKDGRTDGRTNGRTDGHIAVYDTMFRHARIPSTMHDDHSRATPTTHRAPRGTARTALTSAACETMLIRTSAGLYRDSFVTTTRDSKSGHEHVAVMTVFFTLSGS